MISDVTIAMTDRLVAAIGMSDDGNDLANYVIQPAYEISEMLGDDLNRFVERSYGVDAGVAAVGAKTLKARPGNADIIFSGLNDHQFEELKSWLSGFVIAVRENVEDTK